MGAKEREENLQKESHVLCLGFCPWSNEKAIPWVVYCSDSEIVCMERLWVHILTLLFTRCMTHMRITGISSLTHKKVLILAIDKMWSLWGLNQFSTGPLCATQFSLTSLFSPDLGAWEADLVMLKQPASSSDLQLVLSNTRLICRTCEGSRKVRSVYLFPYQLPARPQMGCAAIFYQKPSWYWEGFFHNYSFAKFWYPPPPLALSSLGGVAASLCC